MPSRPIVPQQQPKGVCFLQSYWFWLVFHYFLWFIDSFWF
jgi:hypothetical protein